MRTHATFTADQFETGLAPDAPLEVVPGRELAGWLAAELGGAAGLVVGPPIRQEWGWELGLQVGAQAVSLTVALVPAHVPAWLVAALPVVAIRRRHSGRVDQLALERVLRALHDLLSRAAGIRQLGWHEAAAFDRGVADPAATPFTLPSSERA